MLKVQAVPEKFVPVSPDVALSIRVLMMLLFQ
jgi:hypothetical protein